ncbi:PIN domain-containing protein [Cyanobacteria bacterium FACHB-DQ100]|nr:PIN domain-containing protein [Cyanobacteria bacterium FACHB-DQ100]
MSFLIYLDVCCLNRPFDDQRQERVRLEAEAVLLILERCQSKEWTLLGSEAIEAEIGQIRDPDRLAQVQTLARAATQQVLIDEFVERRVEEWVGQGFGVFDAFHLACAEVADVTALLTTDDRFLRRAVRLGEMLKVRVANPLQWLLEVTSDERE